MVLIQQLIERLIGHQSLEYEGAPLALALILKHVCPYDYLLGITSKRCCLTLPSPS
jgi:hypothetical protein